MVAMIDPFPGHYDASDPFGNIRPGGGAHTGSDWNGLPAGTPIPAISSGTVVAVGFNAGNGNYLCVDMGNGLFWAFLHLDEVPGLGVGAHVTRKAIVAKLGNTGTNSNGAHLHVTISDSPQAYLGLGNKVDPYEYIHAHLGGGGNLYVDPSGRVYRTS